MAEQIITFDAVEQAVSLFGSFDENIRLIEDEFGVSVISRGSDLKICGSEEQVSLAVRALNSLLVLIKKGEPLTSQNVRYAISLVNEGNEDKLSSMSSDTICITSKGRPVRPKTLGRRRKYNHLRHRPRRYRQNVSCCCKGGYRFSCKGSQ